MPGTKWFGLPACLPKTLLMSKSMGHWHIRLLSIFQVDNISFPIFPPSFPDFAPPIWPPCFPQMPRWSATQQRRLMLAFRFLIFRFRCDCWWFGPILLLRGPLIQLPVVFATDYPPVQIVAVTIVLTSCLAARKDLKEGFELLENTMIRKQVGKGWEKRQDNIESLAESLFSQRSLVFFGHLFMLIIWSKETHHFLGFATKFGMRAQFWLFNPKKARARIWRRQTRFEPLDLSF